MNELSKTTTTFENIKHIDENNNEFWYVRELQSVLNYKECRKFDNVMNKAENSCNNSGIYRFKCSKQTKPIMKLEAK